MKFSLFTVTYAGLFYDGKALTVEQQIHKAKELGFDFVGKTLWEQGYLNMSAVDWSVQMSILDARQPFHDLELCRLDESGKKI